MRLDAKTLAAATAAIVKEHVAAATAPLIERIKLLEDRPLPADGKDGRDGSDGKDGKDGRDGVGLAGAVVDRSGVLVLTLSDGSTRELGPVVGKDGEHGRDGQDGKDGEKGVDGRDGFTLEDFDCEAIDERTVLLKFSRGDVTHSYELAFPVPVYRGVFQPGPHERGDVVTWGGSLWHCDKATEEKPGAGEGWTLMVKKGRDGKDAKGA